MVPPPVARDRALRAIVAIAIAATALACWPALMPLHATRAPKLIALGLAGAAAALALARRARRTLTPIDLGLIAYLGAGALSAIVYGRLWTLGAGWGAQEAAAVMLLWAAGAIASDSPDGAPWTLRVVVVAAAAIAVLALAEALGADLGLAGARPTATLGNRDWVATYLVIALPIAVVMLAARPSAIGAAAVALLCAAIVVTRCRGAWIAGLTFAAGGVLACAIARPLRTRGALTAGAVMVAAVALAVLVPWPGLRWTGDAPYWSSLRRATAIDEGTGRTRAVQLPIALAIVEDHPLLGVGPGQWHDAFDEHAHAAADHHVDGSYGTPAPFAMLVRIAAETGLLGLAAFLFAAGALVRRARARWRTDAGARVAIGAALAALATSQVIGLAQPILFNPDSLVLVAVIAGTLRTSAPGRAWTVPGRAARAGLAVAALGFIAIAGLTATAAAPRDATVDELRAHQRYYPSPLVGEELVFRITARVDLGPGSAAICAAAREPLRDALAWSPHHVNLMYRAAHCARVAGDLGATRAWLARIVAIEPHARPQVEQLARAFGVSL